jgi:predicted nuclease of predicted toxin-antitoxin system
VWFLADENFPQASIALLRAAGHDVDAVGETDRRAADPRVLARAMQERRILLTFDRDFGDLIFHHGLPAPLGVVYFRTDPAQVELPAKRLLTLLSDPSEEIVGMFTVIGPDRTRRRPLP